MTRNVKSLLALFALVFALARAFGAEPLATIAVLSGSEGATAVIADALCADLSAQAGVRLVEREALEKILEEQHLSLFGAVAPEKALAVGKLAGADWLLSLAAQGDKLSVRLVQTRDGAVRLEEVFAVRQDPFLTAAAVREKALGALKPQPELASRLTVGIAAFANRSGTERSDAFNAALQKALRERLRAEPWAIVLERQYPTALLNEAELARLGLTQGTKEELPPADLVILGSFEDAGKEFRSGQAWDIKLDLLVRLRGTSAPLALTGRSDQPDAAAQAIQAKIAELRKDPAAQKSTLSEKEFWRRHALYLMPPSYWPVGRTPFDCISAREKADTHEAIRAWENVLLLEGENEEAKLNLGVCLVSLYREGLRAPGARPRDAERQVLRGTQLVETAVRAHPNPHNATSHYIVAEYIKAYLPKRAAEMFRYIVEHEAQFSEQEVKFARIALANSRSFAADIDAASGKGDAQSIGYFFMKVMNSPEPPEKTVEMLQAQRVSTDPLVRFFAEYVSADLCMRLKKPEETLKHYDCALTVHEVAYGRMAGKINDQVVDEVYVRKANYLKYLGRDDEARAVALTGARYFIARERWNASIAWTLLTATEMLAPAQAADGVALCDGYFRLRERDHGMHSDGGAAAMTARREVFLARIEKRALPDFGAMTLVPGTAAHSLYAPTMAVAGGKLWLAWQPWQSGGPALVFDPAVGRAVKLDLGADKWSVRAVAAVGERVYLGTENGLYELDTQGRIVRRFRKARDELPSDHIVSLCTDGGKLYMSFRESDRYGVAALDPGTGVVSVLAPTSRAADFETEPVHDVYRVWWDVVNRRLLANDYFIFESERGYAQYAWVQAGKRWTRLLTDGGNVRYVVSRGAEALQWTMPPKAGEPGTLEFLGTAEKIACAIPLPEQLGEPAWDARRIWIPGYMGLYEIERKSGKTRWLAYQKDTQCLSVIPFNGRLYVATTNGLYETP